MVSVMLIEMHKLGKDQTDPAVQAESGSGVGCIQLTRLRRGCFCRTLRELERIDRQIHYDTKERREAAETSRTSPQ